MSSRGSETTWRWPGLVGEAAYIEDPTTAQGIVDAFRDAELLATAVGAWRSGASSYDTATGEYQSIRDAQALPMYEFTCQLAAVEPPPPELVALLGAVHGNREAMDPFCRLNAGILSPHEFFAEANVAALVSAARQRGLAGTLGLPVLSDASYSVRHA